MVLAPLSLTPSGTLYHGKQISRQVARTVAGRFAGPGRVTGTSGCTSAPSRPGSAVLAPHGARGVRSRCRSGHSPQLGASPGLRSLCAQPHHGAQQSSGEPCCLVKSLYATTRRAGCRGTSSARVFLVSYAILLAEGMQGLREAPASCKDGLCRLYVKVAISCRFDMC